MVFLAQADGLARPAPATGMLARVTVYDCFAAASEAWNRLTLAGLLTPYQHLAFAETWWREIGSRTGIRPLLAVGTGNSGEPAFLWPLGERRHGPFKVAEPLGGKHANYHFGPWGEPALAGNDFGMDAALQGFAAAAPQIDALVLSNQTLQWRGRLNPFAALDNAIPSPSDAYRAALDADPEAYMRRVMSHDARKQVRAKTRKFEAMPGFHMGRAEDAADIEVLLDAFLRQKAARFAQMGVSDPFAAPGTREFLKSLALRATGEGSAALDIYGLHVEGEAVAVLGGIGDGRRFSGMFMSYSACTHARLTPGYVLTAHVVADLCRRGYETFDLGVGEARYKSHFCDEIEELVDVCVPLTVAGRVYASGMREARRVKRTIKRSPRLWSTLLKLRRYRVL